MYKTLHKKQGSVTVQLRFARSSVTFCAPRDNFLNGQTVKLKAGYFAVTEDTRSQGGYNLCYHCDLCTAADADEQTKQKHLETCMITFL